jgi:hypothetical protein
LLPPPSQLPASWALFFPPQGDGVDADELRHSNGRLQRPRWSGPFDLPADHPCYGGRGDGPSSAQHLNYSQTEGPAAYEQPDRWSRGSAGHADQSNLGAHALGALGVLGGGALDAQHAAQLAAQHEARVAAEQAMLRQQLDAAKQVQRAADEMGVRWEQRAAAFMKLSLQPQG